MLRSSSSVLLSFLIATAILGTAPLASAQRVYTGNPITYDFTGYAGLGLQSAPLAGQVDSDEIQVLASSTDQCVFGATCVTPASTFAQGGSTGGVTAGGLYAFTLPLGDTIFGLQPDASVFSSTAASSSAGSIWIRFTNGTGGALGTVRVSDEIWVLNNGSRTSQVSTFFTNSLTATTRVSLGSFSTPTAPDSPAVWAATPFSGAVDLSPLAVADGATFYLVFAINDATGGAMTRDEIGIDDITISVGCGNGTLDAGEACDAGVSNGVSICGCQTSCSFGPAAAACAPTSGAICDVPDTCDGAGTCVNRYVAAGTACRVGTECDATERCTGTGPSCPADMNLPRGTECRAAAGGCDRAELCTGGRTCPADTFQPPGTVCAASSGAPCDVDDVCTGTIACPVAVAAAGTECRVATGVCDVTDSCDGTSTACVDVSAADGADCSDGLACDGDEVCAAGVCAAGTPIVCAGIDACTLNLCDELTGMCMTSAVADCCLDDAACADSAACTTDTCDLTTNTCTHDSIPACCMSAADCDDSDACTTNTCEPGGLCMTADIAGCCNLASECDDGIACTTDDCTGAGGTCTHDMIAGCGVDAAVVVDAGVDGGARDAGVDAGRDAGMRDAATVGDAGRRDAGGSDGSRADGGGADAAMTGTLAGGCGCSAAGATGGQSASLFALGLGLMVVARRRRRSAC